MFSGRAVTLALWSGSLFSGRAAQTFSAAEPLTPAFSAAEPLNIYERASIFFKRAHMKRDSYFSMHNVLASASTNAVHGDIPYGRIQAATP